MTTVYLALSAEVMERWITEVTDPRRHDADDVKATNPGLSTEQRPMCDWAQAIRGGPV